MAIDSASKRLSSLDHEEIWTEGLPVPDGVLDAGDRAHSIHNYSGIAAAAEVLGGGGRAHWRDLSGAAANKKRKRGKRC